MAELQVKGRVLEATRREILARVEAGALERARLEGGLGREHAGLLDAALEREGWYPLGAWERLVVGLLGAEDARGPEGAEALLARCGRRLADALLEEGARAGGLAPSADPAPWWEPVGFALVSLPASLLSHTSWVLLPAEAWGRLAVSVTGAEALPEAFRHLGRGLLERAAGRLLGAPLHVTSARPERGRIVFHARP